MRTKIDPFYDVFRTDERAAISGFVLTNFEKLVLTLGPKVCVVQEGSQFFYRPNPKFKGDKVDRQYVIDSITRAAMYGSISSQELQLAA